MYVYVCMYVCMYVFNIFLLRKICLLLLLVVRSGRLKPDGVVLKSDGQTLVTKAAIEPVWYLPGSSMYVCMKYIYVCMYV